MDGGPPLAIIAAYDFVQFQPLMRMAEPPGGRDLGDLGEVARETLLPFNAGELVDLCVPAREGRMTPVRMPR